MKNAPAYHSFKHHEKSFLRKPPGWQVFSQKVYPYRTKFMLKLAKYYIIDSQDCYIKHFYGSNLNRTITHFTHQKYSLLYF